MPTTTPNLGLFKPLVNDPTDQDLWGGYLNQNADTLDIAVPNATPTGIVAPFAGSAAPTGWLMCYGQAVSRTTYAALFAVVGTTYGTGDGSTTFNVPDMRGRTIAGVDNMGGSAANRITAGHSGITGTTLGAAGGNEQLHTHTHTPTLTDPGHTHTTTPAVPRVLFDGTPQGLPGSAQVYQFNTMSINAATTGISVVIGNAGGGASENVQPTIMLNYIIKQ